MSIRMDSASDASYNKSVHVRPLSALGDYPAALRFFQRSLREGSPCQLDSEYPLVFEQKHDDFIFLIKPEKDIQAGLATLVREIEVERGVWARALFIGSVVTAPEHRNRGLQRILFYSVEEAAEALDVDLLVLWSNQIEFYRKLGFELGGLQASWIAGGNARLAKGDTSVRVTMSHKAELTDAHYEAFDKKVCRVKRTKEEMARLWKIPLMKIAMTDRAYALLGKGEDFQGVCHEWAGPADEVLSCMDALRIEAPNMRILSPGVLHDPDEMKVTRAFEVACFENRLEYLGLFKCLTKTIRPENLQPDTLKFPFFIWGLDSI